MAMEFIQELLMLSEAVKINKKAKPAPEQEDEEKTNKSVSRSSAAAVYHRDYMRTRHKKYRTEQ